MKIMDIEKQIEESNKEIASLKEKRLQDGITVKAKFSE